MGAGAPEPLTELDDRASPELRWRRRPLLRASIRLAAVVTPAAAAVVVGIAFSRTIPPPGGLVATIEWWVGFMAAFGGAWLITAELLQRALPLATLLDLTLAFP